MKTSDLTGKALDYALAKAMGQLWCKPTHGSCCTCQTCGHGHDECLCNAEYNDELAMRLIAQEKIELHPAGDIWSSVMNRCSQQYGETPILAVLRCYITSRLGEEIDIPKEVT